MKTKKIKALEKLASKMIGDGKYPHLFFVSQGAKGVILVSRSFQIAYKTWKSLDHKTEDMLEGRCWGIICDTCPNVDNPNRKLVTWDDSKTFLKHYTSCKND